MEFSGHLWLPLLYQPQSEIVVFEGFTFQIYKILVTKWKHWIGPNYILSSNEELELNSTLIIELVNIDESSHEEAIVIFITNKDLNNIKKIMLQRITIETDLNDPIKKQIYIMILIYSWSLGRE